MNRQLPPPLSLCLNPPLSLCLNPDCPEEHRLCSDEDAHGRCDGWIHSLAWLRSLPSRKALFSNVVNADYLLDPIGSIYSLEQHCNGWEDALADCFQQARRMVNDELAAAYSRCRSSMAQHMIANRLLFAKIQCFSEGVVMGDNEEYFHEYLESDLRAIQQAGCIALPDHAVLSSFLQTVMKEVSAVEQACFTKENAWDIKQRNEAERRKEELYYFTENASLPEVNEKLQELENMCGRQLRITEGCQRAQVECLFCPLILTLQDASIKACRRRCRLSVLHHMCTTHTKEILQRGRGGTAVRVSLEELRAEMGRRQVRRASIVDRENVHFALPADPNAYCLEVVSLNGLHLVTGKYLLAESKGRDAADILVMLALYEMALLRIKEVILYTKDHYGMTLVPIFAQIGLTVTIATTPNL